ncbi:MAG: RteC domain-containing protein [Cytophagales bacterium]|nr:RteC domain-containing protein [Cytophagales bacterium]
MDTVNDNIDTCNQLIKELRERYEQISLTEQEQITFFKHIKPLFSSELLFLGLVLRYYQGKPKNNPKGVRVYIKDTRGSVNTLLAQYQELHNYIEFKSIHLDQLYFSHRLYEARLHGSLIIPIDPQFSSPADPTLSLILANEKFLQFLRQEYALVADTNGSSNGKSRKSPKWLGSKTEFVLMLYALIYYGIIDMELNVLSTHAQQFFNIEIDNIYRTFNDIKRKKDPTEFLDKLKDNLNERIREEIESNHA